MNFQGCFQGNAMQEIRNDSHTDEQQMKNNENPGKYCYRYPHPAVTADCVIFGFNGKGLKVLLVERGNEPYLGCWALPGGFMHIDESIEAAAARELREETNLNNVYLEQFRVFSRPDRDPRERVVTVAFIALIKPEDYEVIAGDDAANALWFDAKMLPPLAFDHREIIHAAREYLKEILRLKPVAFELLNKVFTIGELQTVYEVINEASYDRRNFLRTAIDSEVITEVPFEDAPQANNGRPIKLYTASITTPENDMPPIEEAQVSSCDMAFGKFKCEESIYHDEESADAEIADSAMFEEEWDALPTPHASKSFLGDDASYKFSKSLKRRANTKSNPSPKSPTKGLFDFFRRK